MDDHTQVGWVRLNDGSWRAALWRGYASTFVDLHTDTLYESEATGVWGDVQVGYADSFAVTWRGTKESMRPLPMPTGSNFAIATGIHGKQVVGWGSNAGAVLWNLSTGSIVNLRPRDWLISRALATNGNVQVGEVGGYLLADHAVAWHGNAESMIDLHTFLPPEVTSSDATGIDEEGNIVGTGTRYGKHVPIVWKPIRDRN